MSFQRKSSQSSQPKPPVGTRLSSSCPSVLNTSTGIPSLDDILGGGVQLSTSLLVLTPDPHSAYGDLIQRYFIAQGLANGQGVCIFDANAQSLVEGCMWMQAPGALAQHQSTPDDDSEHPPSSRHKVKIAWRYENMQKFQTTVSALPKIEDSYCRPLDLTCRIPKAVVSVAKSTGQLAFYRPAGDTCFDSVATFVEDLVKTTDSQALRISIPSFANPTWGDATPENIIRFLYRLRFSLRSSARACALVTFPSHICSETWGGPGWIAKLGWMSDGCISLDSFTADPAMTALFPSHHGLLHIHTLPSRYTLVPPSDRFSTLRGLSAPSSSLGGSAGSGENNLAFKCTRKRLLFETLHLDLEGGVGERRTTPSAASLAQEAFTVADHSSMRVDPLEKGEITHAGTSPAVAIGFDEPPKLPMVTATLAEVAFTPITEKPKKTKKKVGFRADRPELYEF